MAIEPISKFGTHNGQTESLAEYRIRRRNGRKSKELSTKTQLRVRDGIGCRWPGCEYWKHGVIVEGVHLVDKGMGGDPKQLRTQLDLMIRLCKIHHQGPVSIHSGHRVVEFLTERKTNGPCTFKTRKADGVWITDGIENEWDFRSHRNEAAADSCEDDE